LPYDGARDMMLTLLAQSYWPLRPLSDPFAQWSTKHY